MIPGAYIIHQTAGRIRLRIKGVKGNRNLFFERLGRELNDAFDYETIRVNPGTGSLLLADSRLDPASIARFARKQDLFHLAAQPPSTGNPVTFYARRHVKRIESGIKQLTGGRLDMGSTVFFVLILHAMREIALGRLTVPSWFTALWFAHAIYDRDFTGTGDDGAHGFDGSHAGE